MAKPKKKTATPRKKSGGSKGKKKKRPVKQKTRIGFWFFWAGLFFLSAFALSYIINRDRVPQNEHVAVPVNKASRVSSANKRSHALKKKIYPCVREEVVAADPHVSDLAARIREIDLAVLQTVVALGHNAEILQHSNIELKKHGQEDFHYQTLRLSVPVNSSDFTKVLRSNLALVNGTELQPGKQPGEFHIVWQQVPTHAIYLASSSVKRVSEKKSCALLVVIIDDIGESKEAFQRLAALDFPVTMSVLPFTSHTREAAHFARQKKMELMLHLPCEPIGYPKTADPGPGGLFVGMSDSKILALLQKDIAAVPGVIGVNNHMGSRFTQDERRMRVVLRELRRQNLFFLDSLTSPGSSVRAAAAKEGLPYIRRNIFLDNVQKEAAILHQLRKAEALARKKGACVAIGHPYSVTLETLEKWQHVRDKQIVMTTVSRLLKEKEAKR